MLKDDEGHLNWAGIIEAASAGFGMCLFSLYVHSQSFPAVLSFLGFALVAVALSRAVLTSSSVFQLFGLTRIRRKDVIPIACGVVVGIVTGIWYRVHCGWTFFPQAFSYFIFVAALIGGAEELLYRGYLQCRVKTLGVVGAVLVAALFHTAYKTSLFMFPDIPAAMDIRFLATWTFLGGLLFGGLRVFCGNIYLPLAAHISFDIIVYSNFAHAPWWVWA